MCGRWSRSFEKFLADMGERPEGKSLERLDVNKGYTLGNCVWATPSQQSRNTRRNRRFTYQGKTQCVAAWAEEVKLSYHTLWSRLCVRKWDVAAALLTPVGVTA